MLSVSGWKRKAVITILALLALASLIYTVADQPSFEETVSRLKDEKWFERGSAAQELGDIKDARAVEPLIAGLKDEEEYVREQAATALGTIKDARAVEPLIAALKDKNGDVREAAADALGEIPDERRRTALSAALKSGDTETVAGAYRYFVREGTAGSEAALIRALTEFGDKTMAEDFLNCGNAQLASAARGWAKEHGYTIKSSHGFKEGPGWGRK